MGTAAPPLVRALVLRAIPAAASPFLSAAAAGGDGTTGDRARRAAALGATRFRAELDGITALLTHATPRFIRCVKSNGSKRPLAFERPLVLHQARARPPAAAPCLCSRRRLARRRRRCALHRSRVRARRGSRASLCWVAWFSTLDF